MKISELIEKIRDWRRGFADNDIVSAEKKMSGVHKPGAVILVSDGEMKAIIAMKSKVKLRGCPTTEGEI